MPEKTVGVEDVVAFARRVERLCDFLLDKVERDGSNDVVMIQDLREEARDMQADDAELKFQTLEGLADYMKGGT
jgi:hypothetical protein